MHLNLKKILFIQKMKTSRRDTQHDGHSAIKYVPDNWYCAEWEEKVSRLLQLTKKQLLELWVLFYEILTERNELILCIDLLGVQPNNARKESALKATISWKTNDCAPKKRQTLNSSLSNMMYSFLWDAIMILLKGRYHKLLVNYTNVFWLNRWRGSWACERMKSSFIRKRHSPPNGFGNGKTMDLSTNF